MAGVVDGMPEDHLQYAQHSIAEEPSACGTAGDAQRWALVAPYLNGLPAMPSSVFRLNAILSSTPIGLREVSEVVSGDLSIAAQVLRLTCLECGAEADISKLDDCVVLLGIRRLRDLVLTMPLLPLEPAALGELNALWQHSPATALLSERIAFEFGYAQPARAYVAGLLHDIGKVPLILGGGERMSCGSVADLEHCLLGAALAEKWGLPPYLREIIKHHHDPEAAGRDSFLAAVVAAADQFTNRCRVEVQSDSTDIVTAIDCDSVFESVLRALGGEDKKIAEFVAKLRSRKQAGDLTPCLQ
jgi:putative nucleotidyltransferase with HDIG domain